ncbi:monocarboxylate transporter, putative [Ixodes scapularis]|uniref:Monocarboxylate transporter, putative n=1 Tax=Ixodes scapularis TaxID=6945 RepID=B7PKS0_IXOSC|nr:monocarboxylate transporter, putative [Ixodes scapularis]|eukprot:XP_002434368.1 monocarboxylate transporter, putative [Ixodes scapularis]
MDSARSWLVAGACCWINVFSCAMVVSSGIVYVNILQTLDVTREQASWPVSLMTNVYMVAGLVASVASRHFSIRSLFLAACLLGSLAIGACYFASKIWHFVVFFGIMYGSLGFLRLTSVAVNQHFHSYKAAASGINVAGFSIAGLIFPPLAQLIFDTYGFRGAFLMYAAIMLHSTPAALLQRPPAQRSSMTGSKIQRLRTRNASATLLDARGNHNVPFRDNSELTNRRRQALPIETFNAKQDSLNSNSSCNEFSEDIAAEEKMLGITCSNENLSSLYIKDELANEPKQEPAQCANGSTSHKTEHSSSSDPLLIFMARPKFYLVTLTHLAAFANMTTYISVVVDFAEDRGIAKWDAISIISSFTVTDLVARLCSGWITDRKHVSRSTWVSFNFGLWALTLVLMPACSSHPGQMVFAAVYGWTTGCVLTLVPVLYAEVANLDQFAVCFGTGSCIVGAITMLRPVIIGKCGLLSK